MRYGLRVKFESFSHRYEVLKRKGKLHPNFAEKVVGAAQSFNLLYNIYAKYQDETMIFMFNPCHFTAVSCMILL